MTSRHFPTEAPSSPAVKLAASTDPQPTQGNVFGLRMSPEAIQKCLKDVGYDNLADFCSAVGLPSHVAERWSRFGVSSEMGQILAVLIDQAKKFDQAVAEFEEMTHVGLDDFMRERGLI